MNNSQSVRVDGDLLASDRKGSSLSVRALVEKSRDTPNTVQISKSTIERAERGQHVRLSSLKAIADMLEQPYERYLGKQRIHAVGVADLSGDWEGLYVEPDMQLKPSVAAIRIVLEQKGGRVLEVAGQVQRPDELVDERLVDSTFIGDMLVLQSYVESWTLPSGFSSTMLKVTRGGDMLDGYATWYDLDTQKIECSAMMLVRKSSPYFDEYMGIIRATIGDSRDHRRSGDS